MKIIDEFSMRKATIFELRNIARDIGVPSPTIYKKEELIEKVLKVLNGEVTPTTPKTRQGRPPKAPHSFYNLELNSKQELNNVDDDEGVDYNFELPANSSPYLMQTSNFETEEALSMDEVSGLVYVKNDGSFLLAPNTASADNAIFIPKSVMTVYSLQMGDYVEGICKTTPFSKTLESVKNEDFYKNRLQFDSLARKSTTYNPIKVNQNLTILENTRNILKINDFKNTQNILSDLKQIKNHKILSLNLDVLPDKCDFVEENDFVSVVGNTVKKTNLLVNMFVERVKRLVEKGEKLILFVDEVMKLIKYQNFFRGYNLFDIKEYTFSSVMELLNLPSSYENGASVTLVALFKEDNTLASQTINNEFVNLQCNIL